MSFRPWLEQPVAAFDGGLQAPGTGLIHFGARYYNPAYGQWTQPDPTGQNPGYTYAGDNPVNNTDPGGQDFFGDIVGGITAIASGIGGITGTWAASETIPFALGVTTLGIFGFVVVGGAVLLGYGIYEAAS